MTSPHRVSKTGSGTRTRSDTGVATITSATSRPDNSTVDT